MDHRNAIETHATERYLLSELPSADAEEFELHYFECGQCALAVESGGLFITAARERFSETQEPRPNPATAGKRSSFSKGFSETIAAWLRPGFTVPVMAVLAAVILYQGMFQIPGLRRARPLPTFTLIGVSRGVDRAVHVPAGEPFISLEADIPPDAHFSRYLCVLSHGADEVFRVVNPAPEDGHPIATLVPTGVLRAGEEVLTVSGVGPDGQASDKISTYRFDFQTTQ